MYLLDSSAIAITLKELHEKSIELLDGKDTLNLAYYEIGNIIWKECVLKRLISPEEAVENAEGIAKILGIMKIEKINSSEDFMEAMKLATRLKLTFYDASYLYVAKRKGLTLVTEDDELYKKAKENDIKVIKSSVFVKGARKASAKRR